MSGQGPEAEARWPDALPAAAKNERRRLLVGVFVAVVVLAAGSFPWLARDFLHGRVNGRSLAIAVSREAAGGVSVFEDEAECRKLVAEPKAWSCSIASPEGSGGASYTIRMEKSGSCWTGRKRGNGSESSMRASVSGCVHLWQWTALSALF